MVYWHVERRSVCIYSQLKTVSSSEVAAMIEGVLRHGKSGEVATNRKDEQEVALLALHLLQVSLVYINTTSSSARPGRQDGRPRM